MARGKQGVFAAYLQEMFLDYLEEEARRLLLDAISTADFQNRSYNLRDSYGYGVFLNGSLKRSSILSDFDTQQAEKPRKWYKDEIFGRDLQEMAFEKRSTNGSSTSGGYAPSGKRGFVIVLAAAMPYAVVLEQGGYDSKKGKSVRFQRKYHVISQIMSDCDDIGKSLVGKSLVSHVDLKYYDFLNEYR